MAERYSRLRDFALLLRNIESFTAGQARIVSYEEDALRNIDVELCPSDGPYKGGTFFFRVCFINTEPIVMCEDFGARARHLGQAWVITLHSKLWDVITYSCPGYRLLEPNLFTQGNR